MSELHKTVNNIAIFKQKWTQKLFKAFKMTYSCWFSLGENLNFLDFLQEKFYHINFRYLNHIK